MNNVSLIGRITKDVELRVTKKTGTNVVAMYIAINNGKDKEGKELPDFGACKHYKHSLRWFRFSCCNKIFPCDICHDEASDHNCENAKTILCGFCSVEQSSSNKVCTKCGKMFTKSEGGKKFWEGGKGCRNPQFIGTRDSHKYTGLYKTISRKQQKKIQNQIKKIQRSKRN